MAKSGNSRMSAPRRRRLQLLGGAVALAVIAVACRAVPSDYTGDRTSDLVYRDPMTGYWYEVGQSAPIWQDEHVGEDDIPAAADYDGDGKIDPAVVRGTTWMSSAFSTPVVFDPAGMPAGPPPTPAGTPGGAPLTLVPVPGDYDGAGKDVPAFYDQVDATWWITGHASSVQFGLPPTANGTQGYDVPVPADYDGDGKTDIAVFRPTDGSFHYLSSKTGQQVVIAKFNVNQEPGDEPLPGDYDGVGHAEAAVVSNDGGVNTWYVAGHDQNVGGFNAPAPDGEPNALPILGDYNGDGKIDPAIMAIAPNGTSQIAKFQIFGSTTQPTFPLDMFIGADTELPPGIATGWLHVEFYGLCHVSPYYC